ncbi:hypothetical protein GCM10027067_26630 [Pseudactinotalea suaedae]
MTRATCDRVYPKGGPEGGVPGCGEPIEWARTIPGQRRMPLDLDRYPDEDERANVAVMPHHTGPYCRVVTKDEPLRDGERRRMPHFATCPVLNPPPPPDLFTDTDHMMER